VKTQFQKKKCHKVSLATVKIDAGWISWATSRTRHSCPLSYKISSVFNSVLHATWLHKAVSCCRWNPLKILWTSLYSPIHGKINIMYTKHIQWTQAHGYIQSVHVLFISFFATELWRAQYIAMYTSYLLDYHG